MNDTQQMLAAMADGLFAELGSQASLAEHWPRILEASLTGLLVREGDGGSGGTWEDALIVFRLAGYHALSLPLVEATIAARIAGTLEGLGSLGASSEGSVLDGKFSGSIAGIPWGRDADFVIAPAPCGGGMLVRNAGARMEKRASMAGEPRDRWELVNARVTLLPDVDILGIGAFARVSQSAGALDAALGLAIAHVNERRQFGRPIAKFQAVQQSLATLACEAAAVNCAALGAARAMEGADPLGAIAAAKVRAGEAIGSGTAIAHQVHGAIGFTQEYGLHPLTRRLWCWRSEFGGDGKWASLLGARVVAAGEDRFWSDLVARSE